VFGRFFPNRTGGVVKMCLAVAVGSRWKSAACVFALWVFANRIEFPGGWPLAIFTGGGRPSSGGVLAACFQPIYFREYGGVKAHQLSIISLVGGFCKSFLGPAGWAPGFARGAGPLMGA